MILLPILGLKIFYSVDGFSLSLCGAILEGSNLVFVTSLPYGDLALHYEILI